MAFMRQDNRRTSSATRQARIKGTAGGSQPRPRATQVSTMKQQGPLKPKATTTSKSSPGLGRQYRAQGKLQQGPRPSRNPATTTKSGQGVRPGGGAGRVTTNNRSNSPRLPNLPRNPVTGTTNTIRATGGGSRDAKINRLSAQAAKPAAKPTPRGPQIAPSSITKVASTAMSLRKLTPAGLAYETLKARPTGGGYDTLKAGLAKANQTMAAKKKKKG